jgi:carbon starvation protein
MFGIANQLLAGIALCVVSTWLFREGRGRYAWVTIAPMVLIVATTFTAGAQLIQSTLWPDFVQGVRTNAMSSILRGGLSSAAIVFLITAFSILLGCSINEWLKPQRQGQRP